MKKVTRIILKVLKMFFIMHALTSYTDSLSTYYEYLADKEEARINGSDISEIGTFEIEFLPVVLIKNCINTVKNLYRYLKAVFKES